MRRCGVVGNPSPTPAAPIPAGSSHPTGARASTAHSAVHSSFWQSTTGALGKANHGDPSQISSSFIPDVVLHHICSSSLLPQVRGLPGSWPGPGVSIYSDLWKRVPSPIHWFVGQAVVIARRGVPGQHPSTSLPPFPMQPHCFSAETGAFLRRA